MSAAESVPARVLVREVGPRDGFQNEPETIATPQKVELIEALAGTGLARIEVTSFVRADRIPQLADAEQVLRLITVPAQVQLSVLVPNERGLQRALELRERVHGERRADRAGGVPARPAFDAVAVFLSASESHNRANVNRSVAESLTSLEAVIATARVESLHCEAVISTSFGCPYEGRVAPERVLEIAARLREAGAAEVALADTTGMANPLQVGELFGAARERLARPGDGGPQLTAHFHNTRGQGLANVLAALQAGVDSFESSFGELGGCPVPAGATGNIASEDLVVMLAEMGIETGIDASALIACARRAQEILGRPLGSHTVVAGPVDWEPAPASQER
ncbi:MAG: hydroxymethylglutaryl-CoA lyase [Acidobacteriota bacterium]|nr:hydroxymethylglutaryl-CoA lyase [Acidobacteriota bacterium]